MTDVDRTNVALARMLDLMSKLRDPQHGCPWDLKQNFKSIAPHTLEEVYEVIEAIEQGNSEQLKSELGDLLFQIVFYAQLGKEAGMFDFADIATAITNKLLHRHPHVFPDATFASFGRGASTTADSVTPKWEAIKAAEREASRNAIMQSALDDVPLALPALLRAAKLQKRAAGKGFDWPDTQGVVEKLKEELMELQQEILAQQQEAIADEFGDLLFTMVNLSRHLKVEPEQALRAANHKFEKRFRRLEELAHRDGCNLQALTLDQLETYWLEVKREQNALT